MRATAGLPRFALILMPWLLLLALWYVIRASGLVNPSLVPAPHAVFSKFVERLQAVSGDG